MRHTAVNVPKGICYGQADVPLKDNYLIEFETIRQKLSGFFPAKVYSSPMIRCKQLAGFLDRAFTWDERLLELDFGDWELKQWESIPQEALNSWMSNFVSASVPGGESYLQLYHRTTNFVQTIATKQHDRVVLVTHAGVIRALLAYFDHVPLEKSFNTKIAFSKLIRRTI